MVLQISEPYLTHFPTTYHDLLVSYDISIFTVSLKLSQQQHLKEKCQPLTGLLDRQQINLDHCHPHFSIFLYFPQL